MEERTPSPEAPIPPSVSYRQLANLLSSAPGEPDHDGEISAAAGSAERQAFETLLAEWSRSGHRLLAALGQGGTAVSEGRSPRQLMALGALQAHLALALQAHAGTSGPQAD